MPKRATVGKIVAGANAVINGAGVTAALNGALPPKYAFVGLLAGLLVQAIAPSALGRQDSQRVFRVLLLLCAIPLLWQSSIAQPEKKFIAPTLNRLISPNPQPIGKQFVVASVAFWGCAAADSISTETRLRAQPDLRESNPLLGQSSARRQVLTWTISAGVYAVFYWLKQKHPQAANRSLWLVAGLHCGAATWNFAR